MVWGWTAIDQFGQDFRYALRLTRKSPGFAAIAVLILALGIGANTAIFSLVDAVMLRALPVHQPRELVLLSVLSRSGTRGSFSHGDYEWLRDRNEVFSGVLASSQWQFTLRLGEMPERIAGATVSGNYFAVLGVPAALGRTLTTNDDQAPGAHPYVVVSDGFWHRRFGRSRSILGTRLSLNGVPFEIVGVAPPEFFGETVGNAPEVWVPLAMQPQLNGGRSFLNTRNVGWLELMARLQPGIRSSTAQANLAVLLSTIQAERRIDPRSDYLGSIGVEAGSGGLSILRQQFSAPLRVLMAIVSLVLLITCANVASLLLARAEARRREFAVRVALGAGRGRLVRQALTESLLLALTAGVTGLLIAQTTAHILLPALAAGPLGVSLNSRVLIFTAAVSLMTAVLFGLAPALRCTRVSPGIALKLDGRAAGGAPGRWLLTRLLVTFQVALSLALLVGAGLFLRTLYNLHHLDAGFDRDDVVQIQIDSEAAGYRGTRAATLARDLIDRIRGVPGVVSSSVSAFGFGQGLTRMCCIAVEGYTAGPDEDKVLRVQPVSPQYFATMGIPLLAGRDFTQADGPGAPEVAVINEAMARHYFGTANPVGRRFGWGTDNARQVEIVGVVKNAKYDHLREQTPRMVYLSYLQHPMQPNFLTVRLTSRHVAATMADLRRAVQDVDHKMPIRTVATLGTQVNRTLQQEQMMARLSTGFGLLALVLAAVGLYGVTAYTVSRRTAEMGLRMALGADPANVRWLVLREQLLLVSAGLTVGLGLAIAATRLISHLLFGLSPQDPLSIVAAAVLLIVVAAAAGYVPARRASRVDPLVALRYE